MMNRKWTRIAVYLLAAILLLSCGMTAFAADENTFDPTIEIENGTDQITVTVRESNDAVLAEKQPSLIVACSFETAYVTYGETVVASTLDTAQGKISFVVAAGGEYVIHAGQLPVVVTPTPTPVVTPTPTPEATPTPTPVVTPTPTPDPNATGSDVQTGDDGAAVRYGVVLLLSVGALTGIVLVLKRRRGA